MRSISHSKQLKALAQLLEDFGRSDAARLLRDVLDIGIAHNARSMSSVVKAIGEIEVVDSSAEADVVLNDLRIVEAFSQRIFSTSFNRFYSAFVKQIDRLSGMDLENVLVKLKVKLPSVAEVAARDAALPKTVDQYVAALDRALHDPVLFPVVYEGLKTDRAMKKDDVVDIASSFAFPISKSTTKKKALQHIWQQFETSQMMAAKVRAQAGKSAA